MNDLEVKKECPNTECKGEIKIKFKDARPGKVFKCPKCGAELTVDSKDFVKLAATVKSFEKNISKTFKK